MDINLISLNRASVTHQGISFEPPPILQCSPYDKVHEPPVSKTVRDAQSSRVPTTFVYILIHWHYFALSQQALKPVHQSMNPPYATQEHFEIEF